MAIEIKGFLETSFLDWPGKICAVLFLPGCNFRCPYCHNHPLVFHPERYPSFSLDEILDRLEDFRGWIDGLCVTGGEPTLHPDLRQFLQAIRERSFPVKLDTNGSDPQRLAGLMECGAVDFVAMDVKAPLDSPSYRRSAGTEVDLERIVRSIELIKTGTVEHEFRMTVVPGLHQEQDIRDLARQLGMESRLVLQNFNPEDPLDSSLKGTIPFSPEALAKIQREIDSMR